MDNLSEVLAPLDRLGSEWVGAKEDALAFISALCAFPNKVQAVVHLGNLCAKVGEPSSNSVVSQGLCLIDATFTKTRGRWCAARKKLAESGEWDDNDFARAFCQSLRVIVEKLVSEEDKEEFRLQIELAKSKAARARSEAARAESEAARAKSEAARARVSAELLGLELQFSKSEAARAESKAAQTKSMALAACYAVAIVASAAVAIAYISRK